MPVFSTSPPLPPSPKERGSTPPLRGGAGVGRVTSVNNFSGKTCHCHIHTEKPSDSMNCRCSMTDIAAAEADSKGLDSRRPSRSDSASARLSAPILIAGNTSRACSTPGIRRTADSLKSSITRFSARNPALYFHADTAPGFAENRPAPCYIAASRNSIRPSNTARYPLNSTADNIATHIETFESLHNTAAL